MWFVGLVAGGVIAAVTLTSCTVNDDEFGVAGQVGATGGVGGATAPSGSLEAGGSGSSVCDPAPCMHGGQCKDLGGGRYQCACAPGFGGNRCELDIDDCAVDRCKNGGACSDRVNDYVCRCAVGYEGKDCELPKNDCAGMPCQNGGECIDGNARYTCACQAGFSGLACERAVSGCEDAPCLNGECSDTDSGYACACTEGFTGYNCEIDIDECLERPCENDGECIDGANGRTCRCKSGFSGPDCAGDIDECEAAPCRNGGECTNRSPGFECRCPPEWTGKTCDLDVDECASPDACPADRACINETGGHACPCAPGTVGDDCERILDILPVLTGYDDCIAMDVSADGSFVVGSCSQQSGSGRAAFRWSEALGLESLEGLRDPAAREVSDDGAVVSGNYTGSGGGTVFRWTRAAGMVELGLSGNPSLSGDGTVIAAGAQRWMASGIQSISPIINAAAISGDGNVVAGSGQGGQGMYRRAAVSAQELVVPSEATFVAARGMTTDGTVIVGRMDRGNTVGGIIWSGYDVITDGVPELSAISGDGFVLVTADPAGIWDLTRGLRDLKDLVRAQGATLPEAKLVSTAISRDGRYIVGTIQFTNQLPRAFRAKLP